MTNVRAVESFQAPGVTVTTGDLFPADAPLVAAIPHLFEPVEEPKPARKATKAATEAGG